MSRVIDSVAPISAIKLHGTKAEKQVARENMANQYDVRSRMAEHPSLLELLSKTPLRSLDRSVKHGHNLTFEEAFCGMCYAVAATNLHFFEAICPLLDHSANGSSFDRDQALSSGTAFLQLMAAKESFLHLTPEEVAGIAAACVLLDTVVRLNIPEVLETSGMGGDRGFFVDGGRRKTINASTLSAFVLRATGQPVVKHGSYSNTSAVGSTDAIEQLGSSTTFCDEASMMLAWKRSGFCYVDAHLVKTIHDLSHLLMMETINHVAGPMSSPFSRETRIFKVMGVNEKVDPETVARAYSILHQRKILNLGGVVAVCGLDREGGDIDPSDQAAVRRHTVIDELSPYASVVSFGAASGEIGTYLVTPADFGIELAPESICVPNDADKIQAANLAALSGENRALANYLAMNASMGLLIKTHSCATLATHGPSPNVLRQCFDTCRNAITSGAAIRALELYVSVTRPAG